MVIMLNQRNHEIFHWKPAYSGTDWREVTPLQTEASTRKFWRCRTEEGSFILMYSPPDTEHNYRFIQFGAIFKNCGVPVPAIHEYDLKKGFFLLEDVGSEDFLTHYVRHNVDHCLALAFHTLSNIQAIDDPAIPIYETTRLTNELEIFCHYLCGSLINVNTDAVQSYFDYLVKEISTLPKVTVHRDYHCRNLLVRNDPPYLGVVDFQDALIGPITYDLASLLYDCYWEHENETVERQIRAFWNRGLATPYRSMLTQEDFSIALRLTALQRLLKAAGIFIRLWFQRQQPTHVQYILPTLRKAQSICEEIETIRPLGHWLQRDVIPKTLLQLPRQQ